MDLNFEIFMVVLLVLSILVVGNFLRDEKSNYLEGALLVVRFLSSCLLPPSPILHRPIKLMLYDFEPFVGRLCHYRRHDLVLPQRR